MPIRSNREPGYWQQRRQALVKRGIVPARHARSTKNNRYGIKMKWTAFCKEVGEDDPNHVLRKASKEDIMAFMEWLVEASPRLGKRGSLRTYWKQWSSLYLNTMGQPVYHHVKREVMKVRW